MLRNLIRLSMFSLFKINGIKFNIMSTFNFGFHDIYQIFHKKIFGQNTDGQPNSQE
jgi:hypothetical protein